MMGVWNDLKRQDISHWSPGAKLGLWLGGSLFIVAALQFGVWLVGLEWDVFQTKGVVLAIALGALLGVMGRDRRTLAEYGLSVGPEWRSDLAIGAAIGAAVVCMAMLVGLLSGALWFSGATVSWGQLGKAGLGLVCAPFVAGVQQMIFSGYLLTIFRERWRRWTSVIACGFLFAVLGKLSRPASFLEPESQQAMWGLFAVGSLLAALRFQTGSIVFPTGVLAGVIGLRRVLDKLRLLEITETAWAQWLFPQNDLRNAPWVWACCLTLAGAVLWRVARVGERQPAPDDPGLDKDFKQTFPLSNTLSLAPLDVWLGRLAASRFRVGAKYAPRLAAILLLSAANSVLIAAERLVTPLLLRFRRVRRPVFIVGVHRSGTTHLHNLLAHDSQFVSPTTHHIMNPGGCVFTGWLVSPVLGLFLPYERPMDSVRFGLTAPQEEEFGVCGLSPYSPYWAMTFPQQWAHYDRYLFPGQLPASENRAWRRVYDYFLRQVVFWTARRPLLKNPCNTGRLDVLMEMYPDAKFVHIHRHPHDVHRSNMRLASDGHATFQLQDQRNDEQSYQERFLANYRAMEDAYYREANRNPDRCVEVRFEDLEADPLREITRIYRQLDLELSPSFLQRLNDYLDGLQGYRKNRYQPTDDQTAERIDTVMGDYQRQWGYSGRQRAA